MIKLIVKSFRNSLLKGDNIEIVSCECCVKIVVKRQFLWEYSTLRVHKLYAVIR